MWASIILYTYAWVFTIVVSANDYIKETKFQNAEIFYWICIKNMKCMYAHVK